MREIFRFNGIQKNGLFPGADHAALILPRRLVMDLTIEVLFCIVFLQEGTGHFYKLKFAFKNG